LEIEFVNASTPYEKEKKLPVFYDNKSLNKYFRADFAFYSSIIIEQKASKFLTESEHRQTVNNVKATKFKPGLLINFGTPSLTSKRIVN